MRGRSRNRSFLCFAHKELLGRVGLVNSDAKTSVGISFWDRQETAEAYSLSAFNEGMKALEPVAAGPAQVQACEVANPTVQKIAAAAGA